MGYRDATDHTLFQAARAAGAVIMTKDSVFVRLLDQYGPPPQVLLVTLGNSSNSHMRDVLIKLLPEALVLLESGEPLVEISNA